MLTKTVPDGALSLQAQEFERILMKRRISGCTPQLDSCLWSPRRSWSSGTCRTKVRRRSWKRSAFLAPSSPFACFAREPD